MCGSRKSKMQGKWNFISVLSSRMEEVVREGVVEKDVVLTREGTCMPSSSSESEGVANWDSSEEEEEEEAETVESEGGEEGRNRRRAGGGTSSWRARCANFGVCGVEVFTWQLLREIFSSSLCPDNNSSW